MARFQMMKSTDGNIRMAMPLRSLAKRSDEKKAQDVVAYEEILSALNEGKEYSCGQLRLTH